MQNIQRNEDGSLQIHLEHYIEDKNGGFCRCVKLNGLTYLVMSEYDRRGQKQQANVPVAAEAVKDAVARTEAEIQAKQSELENIRACLADLEAAPEVKL